MSVKSLAESEFLKAWRRGPLGHGKPIREYQFIADRRWAFDFAFPSQKVAVEIEGRGRHHTVAGFRADCEKYNAAASDGWFVYHFPATDIHRKNAWGESILDLFVEQLCERLSQQ